jgi:hypothetical protein
VTGLNGDETVLTSDKSDLNLRQRKVFFESLETYEGLLAEANAEIARLTLQVDTDQELIRDQAAELELNRLIVLDLSQGRTAVLASTSWRLTRPVRAIADLLRRGARR